jgi:addiction module HigA family antidote
MITSFRSADTQALFETGKSKRFGAIITVATRKLTQLEPRINDIVRERRGVTADTAMRLARYFGGDAHSWLNLQVIYDLRLAEMANARKIKREIMPIAV